jgi:hypothetical protein
MCVQLDLWYGEFGSYLASVLKSVRRGADKSLAFERNLFLQDNAAPHKAAITRQKLADLHFEVLKHPVYSPDLTPLDYYLFPNLFIKPKTYQLALCL